LKRKFTPIFLVILLTAPTILVYCWLSYRKATVRNEVQRVVESGYSLDDLVLLSFPKDGSAELLRWENEKEFAYRGLMYDLVRSAVIGDSLVFWCKPDHRETRINKALAGLMNKAPDRDGHQKNLPVKGMKLLSMVYCHDGNPWSAIPGVSDALMQDRDPGRYDPVIKSPPSPPPRIS